VDVGGHRVEIAGEFTMGAGFAADGVVITSDSTWARLLRSSVDQVSIGLLRLRAGGDAERVAQELNARLPRDVRAWPRRALEASERDYWATTAAIGIIFGAGVIVGFAVLIVIVYQIVSSDVTRRTREYATMKALGYHHRALVRVGVEQALILVGAAFVAGLALALLVYTALAGATNLPIQMTLPRVVGVLVAAVGLSAAASLVALRRVRAADPADLF
jgi:putative ABC transport system permease protein